MEPRIINTKTQYEEYLAEIERLVELDPKPGTAEAERLKLLAVLVEKYEKEHFSFEMPDPIEAIRFRMEEQGLRQTDLIPYIGSKGKVSEILSGKKTLTLSMIRALVEGLGIPAKVLLQNTSTNLQENTEPDWQKFPFKEMIKRGLINASRQDIYNRAKELIQNYIFPLNGYLPADLFLRCTVNERSGKTMDRYALFVWATQVLIRAKNEVPFVTYKPGIVTEEFMKKVAQLSDSEQGPLLARNFLAKSGIALIIEPHFSKTKLDGAAMIAEDGRPVIGLTIRFDRIDNFWFTLMHELAHVSKHLHKKDEMFFDDLKVEHVTDLKEQQADMLSRNILIPDKICNYDDAFLNSTPDSINALAKKLQIHSAIVAGRIRRIQNNYYIFNQLVGQGEVRKLFPKINWNKQEGE